MKPGLVIKMSWWRKSARSQARLKLKSDTWAPQLSMCANKYATAPIFRVAIKIGNLSLKLFASAKALSFYSKLHVFCQLSNWCVWVKIHNEFIRAHSSNQKGCRFNYWACAKPALLRLLETCLCNLIKVSKWHAQTWPWRAIKTELWASEPQLDDLRHLCQLSWLHRFHWFATTSG